MVKAVWRLSAFFKHESCGQCTPCREGTGWMWRVLERMAVGEADPSEIDLLLDVAGQVEGHTICALGDAAAWPIQGLINHFRHEIEQRIWDFLAEQERRRSVDLPHELYDVTAWAVGPMAGVDVALCNGAVGGDRLSADAPIAAEMDGSGAFAIAVPWTDSGQARLVTLALREGLVVRFRGNGWRRRRWWSPTPWRGI